jgi:MFS family permease
MNSNDDDDGVMIDDSSKESKAVPLTGKIIFILICACNMVQNAIVGGSNNAIMTTLESGFYMTSTETGLFQSVYELVAIFTYPLVGYFGDRSGRKVRWIAVSMGILACGFLVMSFPHLVESKRGKPPLNPREADHLTLCNPNRNISVCTISNNLRFLSHLKYVFYLSNIINACGSAALPTLAVALVEDIFPQEKAPIAQGE